MILLAVDPGLSGAVVRLDDETGDIEARRDFKTLPQIAKAIVELGEGCDVGVVEFVSSRTSQGVKSVFSFGRSTGVALGACYAMELPVIEVAPGRWQAYWRSKCDCLSHNMPFLSTAVVFEQFPKFRKLVKRVGDHGTADAILLAAYASHELREKGRMETSRVKDLARVSLPVVTVPVRSV